MQLKQIVPSRKWWSSLLVNFLGALLGIIVTFGSSSWLEYRSRQEMAYKIKLLTISDINTSIKAMEDHYKKIEHIDSIFRAVNESYPDNLNRMSKDTLNEFLTCFASPSLSIKENSVEKTFSQSFEIWKNFDDLDLQHLINGIYAIRTNFYVQYDEFYQKKAALFSRFLDKGSISSYKGNAHKGVKAMMEIPQLEYFVGGESRIYMLCMKMDLDMLKAARDHLYKRTKITEQEIDRFLGSEDPFEYNKSYSEEGDL